MQYTIGSGSEKQTNQRVPWGAIAKGVGITLVSAAALAALCYTLNVALEREGRREDIVIERNRELAGTVYKPNEPTIDQINQAKELYKTPDSGKKTIDSHF